MHNILTGERTIYRHASKSDAHLLPMLEQGELHRLLFCPTGALMSPTSSQQGESIPGICHALLLEACL